jgi:hypothetical protein
MKSSPDQPSEKDLHRALEKVLDAARLVMIGEEGSAGRRAIGTALVLGDGLRRIIATAAHVLEGSGPKYFGVPDQPSVPWPVRYSKLRPLGVGLPDADLAWAVADVTPADTALSPMIPLGLVGVGSLPITEHSVLIALGFPASRAKARNMHTVFQSKLMSVSVRLADAAIYESLALDNRAQLAVVYDSDPDRTSPADQKVSPQGMSGGAVFVVTKAALDDGRSLYIPFLIGILTQYRKSADVLVATRVECLIDGLGLRNGPRHPLYERVDA